MNMQERMKLADFKKDFNNVSRDFINRSKLEPVYLNYWGAVFDDFYQKAKVMKLDFESIEKLGEALLNAKLADRYYDGFYEDACDIINKDLKNHRGQSR